MIKQMAVDSGFRFDALLVNVVCSVIAVVKYTGCDFVGIGFCEEKVAANDGQTVEPGFGDQFASDQAAVVYFSMIGIACADVGDEFVVNPDMDEHDGAVLVLFFEQAQGKVVPNARFRVFQAAVAIVYAKNREADGRIEIVGISTDCDRPVGLQHKCGNRIAGMNRQTGDAADFVSFVHDFVQPFPFSSFRGCILLHGIHTCGWRLCQID